ncbi:unnamed protein product [Symbiodinium sp. CCMP2592]|nr:unnamed protein product [Symbiodinium sp. CCMP2592]
MALCHIGRPPGRGEATRWSSQTGALRCLTWRSCLRSWTRRRRKALCRACRATRTWTASPSQSLQHQAERSRADAGVRNQSPTGPSISRAWPRAAQICGSAARRLLRASSKSPFTRMLRSHTGRSPSPGSSRRELQSLNIGTSVST